MTVEMLRPVFASAWKKWGEDRAPRLAAALSFFFLLAMSPLVLFFVAVTGLFLRSRTNGGVLEHGLIESVRGSIGAPAADFIQNLAQANLSRGTGYIFSAIGLLVALFGASGLFTQLRESANDIWGVTTKHQGLKGYVLLRLSSALMVTLFVALLSGWMLLDSWLRILRREIGGDIGFSTRYLLNFTLGAVFWAPVYAAIFKWLPERELEWRDVWLGGVVASLAFAVTKQLLSLYFRYGGVSAFAGTAGAVLVILLWAYYSAQVFFYGLELTKAYAEAYGSLRRQD